MGFASAADLAKQTKENAKKPMGFGLSQQTTAASATAGPQSMGFGSLSGQPTLSFGNPENVKS